MWLVGDPVRVVSSAGSGIVSRSSGLHAGGRVEVVVHLAVLAVVACVCRDESGDERSSGSCVRNRLSWWLVWWWSCVGCLPPARRPAVNLHQSWSQTCAARSCFSWILAAICMIISKVLICIVYCCILAGST